MTKFKLGDRVRYRIGAQNSLNPGDSEGLIIKVHPSNYPYEVRWDTGRHNVYLDDELVLAENGLDEMFRIAFE